MGWGSSTRRGGGRKVCALPRKFVFLGLRREESGMSREFCRDVPDPWGFSKSLCKKKFVRIFAFPTKNGHARAETRILKTLACRNGFWTSFKQWKTACRCV